MAQAQQLLAQGLDLREVPAAALGQRGQALLQHLLVLDHAATHLFQAQLDGLQPALAKPVLLGTLPLPLWGFREAVVRPLLAETVAELAGGRQLDIHPIQDGTAAAAMYAGERDARVIVMGTALGVGAPRETAEHLRPVSLTGRA